MLGEKLSLQIMAASCESFSESDPDLSQLPLVLKGYRESGFGHLQHLYKEWKAVIRARMETGLNPAQSKLFLSTSVIRWHEPGP